MQFINILRLVRVILVCMKKERTDSLDRVTPSIDLTFRQLHIFAIKYTFLTPPNSLNGHEYGLRNSDKNNF